MLQTSCNETFKEKKIDSSDCFIPPSGKKINRSDNYLAGFVCIGGK